MSDKTRKQEVLEAIRNCERRILALEKERNTHIFSRKHEVHLDFHDLEEIYFKYNMERKSENVELQQDTIRIRSGVEALHRMLSNMKPAEPAFVERLKETMEGIESSIARLKEKQREIYETLLLEEQTITQELIAFDKRIASWISLASMKAEPELVVSGGTTTSPTPSMPPAVLAFERFLQQTGGRQGGWDDYDHKAFLRIRSNCSGVKNGSSAFVVTVVKEVPTKTPEEILQHEQWYVEYFTLLERKKKAIEEWREQKKAKSITEETTNDVAISKVTTKHTVFDKQREERFSRLNAWKAEKKHQQMESERLKEIKDTEDAKKRERESKQREIMREHVKEYARTREQQLNELREEEQARKAQELADRARLASREIEMFRERDMRVLEEKKRTAEAKENVKIEKKKQLEKLKEKVSVSHDPGRLYRLTTGWEERMKAEPTPRQGGAYLSMPRRAVPSWRQPL